MEGTDHERLPGVSRERNNAHLPIFLALRQKTSTGEEITNEYIRKCLGFVRTDAGTTKCKGFREEGDPRYDEFGNHQSSDESEKESLHRHVDD